jgi:hypothetical protein
MQANRQRYMIALSLGLRLALAAVNGAAQHHPEAPPAVASVPPSTPAGSGASARATTDRGPESPLSGQLIKAPPLTLYRRQAQPLERRNVTRIARMLGPLTLHIVRCTCIVIGFPTVMQLLKSGLL